MFVDFNSAYNTVRICREIQAGQSCLFAPVLPRPTRAYFNGKPSKILGTIAALAGVTRPVRVWTSEPNDWAVDIWDNCDGCAQVYVAKSGYITFVADGTELRDWAHLCAVMTALLNDTTYANPAALTNDSAVNLDWY